MSAQSPKSLFAENVRRIRTKTGISQEELGERAGLHRTYISSVERGERNVALENIFAIAAALDVSAAELVSDGSEDGNG